LICKFNINIKRGYRDENDKKRERERERESEREGKHYEALVYQ